MNKINNDNVFITRSLGIGTEGLPDQYADGKAARVWELYIGDTKDRTKNYRQFLVNQLRNRKCQNIIDAACGTGVDSIMLVEEGFNMVSVDASDKMLKYALKERWSRRKEAHFDDWVIEEANWLTLPKSVKNKPAAGFDALICLGNSLPHLLETDNRTLNTRRAIKNFHDILKPGGYLIIDHRNYDYTLETGKTHPINIYYTSKFIKEIITSVLYVENVPHLITLDYKMDTSSIVESSGYQFSGADSDFRLSYYPHRLEDFTKMLKEIFGENAEHEVYGDFKPMKELPKNESPGFFIHIIKKL